MVAADRPVIDAGGSDKERCVGEAYDWAIEMLDQWIAWGEGGESDGMSEDRGLPAADLSGRDCLGAPAGRDE